MCTTIGFSYDAGQVFGRTLELGVELDNKILFIPKGAIIDPIEKYQNETLYTSMMNTETLSYHIKCHTNINIQNFSLEDFKGETDLQFIELDKEMDLRSGS